MTRQRSSCPEGYARRLPVTNRDMAMLGGLAETPEVTEALEPWVRKMVEAGLAERSLDLSRRDAEGHHPVIARPTELGRKELASWIERAALPIARGLTPEMRRCHELLTQHLTETGVAPSYRELAQLLGLRSKGGVHRLIAALSDRGLVRALPGRNRSVQLLQPPASIEARP